MNFFHLRLRVPVAVAFAVTLLAVPCLESANAPKDEEFLRAGLFAQPLVPVGSTSPKENTELKKLLVNYSVALRRGDRDDVEPFECFLRAHSHSAWKPALELNLSAVYRRTGNFSKALETWQAAWDDSKHFADNNRLESHGETAYRTNRRSFGGIAVPRFASQQGDD
jgi:hypothetical protein